MVCKLFGNLPAQALAGKLDFETDDIYVALFTNELTINQDTNVYLSDVVGYDSYEVSGEGTEYVRKLLASKTNTYTADGNITTLDAANIVWEDASFTARYALFFKDVSGDPDPDTALLIGYADFEADVAVTNGDFTLVPDADGLFVFTVA